MTEEERADLPALAALVLLDLVAAVCLGRLFSSVSALGPIVAAVFVGHAVALLCRRQNYDGLTIGLIIGAAAILTSIWTVLPQHTAYGFPTGDTVRALIDGLAAARRDFGVAVAPTNPTEGFTIACVFAVIVLTGLADWAAFRIRTTVEAAVPAFTIFMFAAVLGTARHRGTATVGFVGALLVWFVAHNATVIARSRPWFQGTADAGRRALSRAGMSVGTIGLAGALVGLVLPFTQDPPAVAWRNRTRNEARTTISPLVDIKTRLVTRSNNVAFTVQSPIRSYWRITSLDAFDGEIWSSHGSYKDVDPDKTLKGRQGVVAEQQFSIGNLQSIWLPVAYRPASTPTIEGISFDDDAEAFITDKPTSDGLTYSVRSAVRTLTPDALRNAKAASVARAQLEIPTTIDPRVAVLAAQLTQGRATAYDKALAIQQYLRSSRFRYDLRVPPGHGGDAVARFLFETRAGYCEQFAGTFAVLARLAGLPTRVAVGFTAGDRDEAAGTSTVRELHAHAWPEVFLGSAGWVPFEPTPGRGMPGAESYTGAAESQANTERPGSASTLVPTTVARTNPNAPGGQTNPTTTIAPPTTAPPQRDSDGASPWRIVVYVLVALAIVAGLLSIVPLTSAARRRRRWAMAPTPKEKVLVAWTDTDEALRFAGASVRHSQTPTERVERANAAIGDGGVATLTRLGELVNVAAYGPAELSVSDAEAARQDAADVRRRAFATKPRWKFLAFAIDPRRLRR